MSRSEIATSWNSSPMTHGRWLITNDSSIWSLVQVDLKFLAPLKLFFYFSVHENTAPYPCQSPSGGQLVASEIKILRWLIVDESFIMNHLPVSCQARPPPASAKMYQPVPWTENPPYLIVNPFFESFVFWWYETNPPSFVGSPDESFSDIQKLGFNNFGDTCSWKGQLERTGNWKVFSWKVWNRISCL